ncbi:hypothetical protein MOVS_08035 [Moraxella ovis]|uniref:Secreted protein n=1 Tax=Moraxella ovis TaxID=29433 RepID=A0ABM6BDU5_9GAMM|nr:hypothetical protein MOVS_08035 [Moraxella ovis]
MVLLTVFFIVLLVIMWRLALSCPTLGSQGWTVGQSNAFLSTIFVVRHCTPRERTASPDQPVMSCVMSTRFKMVVIGKIRHQRITSLQSVTFLPQNTPSHQKIAHLSWTVKKPHIKNRRLSKDIKATHRCPSNTSF